MIYLDILSCVEKALGTALEPTQRRAAIAVMAADLGGERYYLPHLPKLHRARKIAIYGSGTMTVRQIAEQSGIPVRSVVRLRNGK